MSKASIPRPLRKTGLQPIAEMAAEQGWTFEVTGSGHLRWVSPDGKVVVTPSTPSDRRSELNSRSQLRRAGLVDLPKNAKKKARSNPSSRRRRRIVKME